MDTNPKQPLPAHEPLTRRTFLKTTVPAAIGIGLTARATSWSAPAKARGAYGSSAYGSGAYGSGTVATNP